MTAADLLRDLAAAGLMLELVGDRIRVSDPDRLTEEQRQALTEHRAQVLAQLRLREHARLVAEADALSMCLDDSQKPYAEREARLPEYLALLDKIAELQPYVDCAGVAGQAASAATLSPGGTA